MGNHFVSSISVEIINEKSLFTSFLYKIFHTQHYISFFQSHPISLLDVSPINQIINFTIDVRTMTFLQVPKQLI